MAEGIEITDGGTKVRVTEASLDELASLRDMTALRHVFLDGIDLTPEVLRLVAGLPQIASLFISGTRLAAEEFALLDALPPGAAVKVEDEGHGSPELIAFRHRRANRADSLSPERREEAAERYALGIASICWRTYDSSTVEIQHNDAADDDIRLLRWLPGMEKLQFHRAWGVTTDCLRHLAGHPGLKAIDLNGVKFTDPLQPLALCPALESLDFFPDEETEATDDHTVGLDRMAGLRRLATFEGSFGDSTMERIGRLAELRYLKMTFASIGGDDGLRPLAQLRHLEYLELSVSSPLSSECLRHLAGLDGLCSLDLGNVMTGDGDGLRHLAGLGNLEYLTLWGEGVADAALVHLHTLTNLRVIRLECDRVTREGAVAVAEALPNAAVHWQGKLFRSPRPSVRFRRRAVGGIASALIPIHWRPQDPGGDSGLVWAEDGYGDYNSERLGESGVLGSGLIQLWVEDLSKKASAAEFLRRSSRGDSGRVPKRFEAGVVEAGGGVETAFFPKDGNSCLAGAAVMGGRVVTIQCEAEPEEFEGFRGMFAFIVASLRVGPNATVEEEVDVPSARLA